MELIDDSFEIGFPFHDPMEINKMTTDLSTFSHGYMTECVLAVD
jgi:tryptophan synthase alpha subunit